MSAAAAEKPKRRGGRGKCLACASPKKALIDRDITAGVPFRELVKRYGMSMSALKRHKSAHLSPALIAVLARADAAESIGLVAHLQQLVEAATKVMTAALKSGNGSQALAAMREIRSTLELIGKATGELKERPAVAVNMQSSPEWLSVRQAITELLAPHPELSKQLAQKLAQIDAGVN